MYKIFAVNPGSTSTKFALFEEDTCVFSKNLVHDADQLQEYREIKDQLPYRREMILGALAESGISLEGTAAFVGRGGGLMALEGGTYEIGEVLLDHARRCLAGPHPATLGAQIADSFRQEYGGAGYVVNPPDVDELCDSARITGLKGVYRESRIHALNQKEIGIRYARRAGTSYEELNLIICHIGGGISVTAHRQGRMIDSNDILNGDGPMAPTRCGTIAVKEIIRMCYSGQYSEREMKDKVTKNGGLVDLLGTADVLEIKDMIATGNSYAKAVYDAMIYQIAKTAGAMAAALRGQVDGIILTGGISNDPYLTDMLTDMLGFIADITVMPGEFEMEALAAGALRVLRGDEQARRYSGIPVWQPLWENAGAADKQ